MKTILRLSLFVIILGTFLFSSCHNPAWFVVDSDFSADYDRPNGHAKILWKTKMGAFIIIRDTVYIDSCRTKNPVVR